jgi:hypothetical protein
VFAPVQGGPDALANGGGDVGSSGLLRGHGVSRILDRRGGRWFGEGRAGDQRYGGVGVDRIGLIAPD